MKHQIITVTKDLASVYLGIKEFGPDVVHLIMIDEVRAECQDMLRLLPDSIEVKEYFTEPYDGIKVESICEEIHTNFEGEFQYNLTSGTRIMVISAYNIAIKYNTNTFFISQEDKLISLPSYDSRDLLHSLDNEEILSIYGETIKSFSDLDELNKEDIICSSKIKKFIEKYYNQYTKIKRYFKRYRVEDFTKKDAKYKVEEFLEFELKGGRMKIFYKQNQIFISDNPNCAFLFFVGRWWECLVAQQVKFWSQSRKRDDDIWQSVVFDSESADFNNESSPVKNEIDILVNDDTRLLIMECKSGYISQDNIYRLDSVRETYGGDKSKAILISYYPLDEVLQEKCDDLHIHFFAPSTYQERIFNLSKLPMYLDSVLGVAEIS